MKLLENLLQILVESPMSDEDRRDSDIIRNILKKIDRRPNSASFNRDEKDLLDKYDLEIEDGNVFQKSSNGYPLNREHKDALNDVNFADRLRKFPEREYSKKNQLYMSGDHIIRNRSKDYNLNDINNQIIDKYGQDYYDARGLLRMKKHNSGDKEFLNMIDNKVQSILDKHKR